MTIETQGPGTILEKVVIEGDLSKLHPQERVQYYQRVCESVGLNPYTKPFLYIVLNGKLSLYATRDCADQLRHRDSISVTISSREVVEGIYVVTAEASTPDGRRDSSVGAVPIDQLKGEAKANAMMKAETKSKRRVTLSICGLGWLDETEVDALPDARPVEVDPNTGEVDPNTGEVDPNTGEVLEKPRPAAPLGLVERSRAQATRLGWSDNDLKAWLKDNGYLVNGKVQPAALAALTALPEA